MRGRQREVYRLAWSKRTGKAITHGLAAGYRIHGCHCDECWEAFAASPDYQRHLEVGRAVRSAPPTARYGTHEGGR